MQAFAKRFLPIFPNRFYILFPAIVAAFGGLLFGFNAAVIAGAIVFIKDYFHLSKFMISIVVSATIFGAIFGGGLSGKIADLIGRKKTLIITSFLFLIGLLGSTFADSLTLLIFFRSIVGVAIGIISYVGPVYISEIAQHNNRGRLVAFNHLFVAIGIFLAYLVNFLYAPEQNWRLMFAWGILPAALLFIGVSSLPETPRWLIAHNQEDRARAALEKLRASSYVLPEMHAIKENANNQRVGWKIIFRPWLRSVLFLACGLAILHQLVGIGIFIYYSPFVLAYAGFTYRAAIFITLCLGVVNVLCTFIAMALIDRWGRRPLLIIGFAGMMVASVILAAAFALGRIGVHIAIGKTITLVALALYISFFSIGTGPVIWLVIVEILPLFMRSFAASIATALNWFTNMLVIVSALELVQWFSAVVVSLLYAAFCLLGLIFVIFSVPETRGITLEQIENNLQNGKTCRELGN